jgi:outer membrane protein assembly factor BamE (lipoprotein component of BamABCDE complex)
MTMGWLGRALAAVAALCTMAACDPSGNPLEDLRLARLKVGESTEQDVMKVFGAPAAVRTSPEGKGLVYPLGPEGPYTLLIKLGKDGRYAGRENLLTRDNFAKIAPGMSAAQVTELIGPPGRLQPYALKRQTAWEWRFNDGHETKLFVVMLDEASRVVSTAIEEDSRRQGA